jgi:hypothetical protein
VRGRQAICRQGFYPDIKIQQLLGGDKTVNKALWKTLKLQAVLLAATLHKPGLWHSREAKHLLPSEKTQ